MASYNRQKRNTMMRLENTYRRRAKRVFDRHMDLIIPDFVESLNADRRSFDVDVRLLRNPLDDVFEAHFMHSVKTGVSDGINEVSPTNELGRWRKYGDFYVAEDAIPIALASKRDEVTEDVAKRVKKQKKFSLKALREMLLKDYLSALKAAYRNTASDWIAGESSIRTVQNSLAQGLQATDNEAQKIFRTETTKYFNESRNVYFQENTVMDYMQLFGVTDGRQSQICEDRHRFVIPIGQSSLAIWMPPFHPYCRTIQRPLTTKLASHRRLIDQGERMDPRTFTPLPKNWAA